MSPIVKSKKKKKKPAEVLDRQRRELPALHPRNAVQEERLQRDYRLERIRRLQDRREVNEEVKAAVRLGAA
eukprot:CAMPEP_0170501480 /NCGR_PEP_ID=MMETSP0208-20121228/38439_1 /TAXON_ID=197538 /ORGANISM="Strombidium inclinatum, Strain S3" /LENGTH=70 /DNA_ID=CAMNT_0010780055 /DNA_START=1 /DNA_END=210 /DNA_ORIENTATION=-